jgi:arginyl-tRNA--protein-N-Asp/Glu arginylyltransferase
MDQFNIFHNYSDKMIREEIQAQELKKLAAQKRIDQANAELNRRIQRSETQMEMWELFEEDFA